MHASDFEAVVYDGCEYCVRCLPEGVSVDSEEVSPIFAVEERDCYPVCDACGEEHTYVTLTEDGRRMRLSRGRHMVARVEYGQWYEVETNCGTEVVPDDLVGCIMGGVTDTLDDDAEDFEERIRPLRDYLEGSRVYSVEHVSGYGARMSAPGYMDATEWSVFETEQEAWDYLWEYYGDD